MSSPRLTELEVLKAEAELDKLRQDLKTSEALRTRYDQAARKDRIESDNLERLLEDERAAEFYHRIFTFDSSVRTESVQDCIEELGVWVRKDEAQPIQIVFNSPGGSVFDGLALFDYIRQLRERGTQVDTTALGMAASMGGVLLQAGETRTMSKHSYMLIHEVSAGAVGNTSEMKDKIKFTERLQDRCLDILSERSLLSKRQIKSRWERKDWWLDAAEALEHGFCDQVV